MENRPKRSPLNPGDAHVLVVEDNAPNFALIARLLAYVGVKRCEWKTTGWGVVAFAEQMDRVDLILMDLRLPVEDGYEALAHIRAHPKLGNTLVVLVTALGGAAEMDKAQEAGFDGFISKPLNAKKFPDQIKRILNGEAVWEFER
ncbi:MAG: response regulator [Chloroflexi bacterium]|nr:response regulator [Chloroflexota bacterium]MCI0576136.1 response regulator [Chloroflexota bacterium]MCI0647924.1 response regulator [Chloroflexota bacterium]MCI0727175.1 response regulator [Chloroflexota bacterium]